jgi:hypothetical protein
MGDTISFGERQVKLTHGRGLALALAASEFGRDRSHLRVSVCVRERESYHEEDTEGQAPLVATGNCPSAT